MGAALTKVVEGWEVDTTGDEPRVRDVDVAARGGMSRPRNVRKLIVRNRKELEIHGPLEVCSTAEQTSGGRPGQEFWLSEAQAMNLVALLRTPQARELRAGLVKVFLKLRDEKFVTAAKPATIALDVASGPRLGEVPTLRREIADECALAALASKMSIFAVHGALRRVFRIPGVYQLPAIFWPFARDFLKSLALGRILLPARRKRAPVLRLVDNRQTKLPFGDPAQ